MSKKYIMEMKSKYGIRDGLMSLQISMFNVLIVKDGLKVKVLDLSHTCITAAAIALQDVLIDGC